MHLEHIYRYPVKSMGGQRQKQCELGTAGVPGDRVWALRDLERNNFKTGKRYGALMGCTAELQTEPNANQPSPAVQIGLTNGVQLSSQDVITDRQLSEFLGSPVSLMALQPASNLEHYRRQTPSTDDPLSDPRAIFARTPSEPLPDFSSFPKELFEFESPVGTYFDAYPILLLSRASLACLATTAPNSDFALARFRPTLLVDDELQHDDIFPEDAWVGKTLKIGDAVLAVEMRCPRCIMTTHGFAELPKDTSIMRTLVQRHGGDLGVYAKVLEPGAIAEGDQIQVIS